ncbi:MAG TPA: 4a-hydroxytetrahydrobiopterin dehydratase [Candidatus Paceibacterota bacterium]|nr:4a-hydroxytetrahydrobiopterin dehydratase [Candidatus Paceibacterota bacterium]
MTDLTQKHCVPCEGGVFPLARQESEPMMKEVPGWTLAEDALSISREFKFKNFAEALAFTNKVGAIAEAEGHHPDIALAWGKVGVQLSTHAIGGLSENDFIVAAKINEL